MHHELDATAMVCPYPHSDKTVTTIKAIETRAYGHRFRSRLEARWAVFFESLRVQWEYEPEGFNLEGVPYLPDFRVTTGNLVYWYEIKPRGTDSCEKFNRFSNLLLGSGDHGRPLNLETRLLSGDPFDVFYGKHLCPRCGLQVEPEWQAGEWGFLCIDCDEVTACGGGNPTELGFVETGFYPHKGWIMSSDIELRYMYSKIEVACEAARSARFEHGETP